MGKLRARFTTLTLAILISATGAAAQGFLVTPSPFTDPTTGHPIAGVSVTVCAAGATVTNGVCSPTVTVYSNGGLTQVLAQPFKTDGLGNFPSVYVSPGSYIFAYTRSGVTPGSFSVTAPCVPNSTCAGFARGAAPTDGVMFVSPNGNDSADGLSWGSAKKTLYAAVSALETTVMNSGYNGGTIYVADNVSCGGPVTGQGLWLYRNASSPGTGWIKMNAALNIIGVGMTHWGSNAPTGQVAVNCGSSTQNALDLYAINAPLRISNIAFGGKIGLNINGSSTLTFTDDTFSADSTVSTNGPGVFIGGSSFWVYFRHCVFQANTNSGKPTDGSDSAEAFVVNPGTSNAQSNLIYISQSIENAGDLKFYTNGTTGWANGLQINGLTSEGQSDGKGAVWFPANSGGDISGTGSATLFNVGVADATTSPTPAVQVEGSYGTNLILVAGATGEGQNTIGPMTVLSQYSAHFQSLTTLPITEGQPGPIGGKSFYMTDAGRRPFSPVASRWTNLANQLPSAWGHPGTLTITATTALDGTNNAGQLANSAAYTDYARPYDGNVSLASGDYLIYGVWAKGQTYGALSNSGPQGCSGITTTNLLPGVDDRHFAGSTPGEWEWWSIVLKVSGTNASCYAPQHLRIDSNVTSNGPTYYAPVFYHISAGTVTDSEAAMIGLNLAPYPDSISPPVEATLRGHPFAFGGSGDNYFAALDHTALTANRTYDFPDSSGTVALTSSNVATASALQSTPTLCATGYAARGILANGNATGCFNPTTSVSISSGSLGGSSCTTGSSSYSTCTSTVTISPAQADTNYQAICTGISPSDPRALIETAVAGTASSITVTVVTEGSVAVSFGNIQCKAIHN